MPSAPTKQATRCQLHCMLAPYRPQEPAPMVDPRERMRELQRMADRVCVLILSSDLAAIDIEIEKNKVRERCLEFYPDREDLYEMIYESRFQRLSEQFRGGGQDF